MMADNFIKLMKNMNFRSKNKVLSEINQGKTINNRLLMVTIEAKV